MKYFLDTEFIEGSQNTFFGKSKPTIDLISIGIVTESGREYYAISKDFNLKEAWNRHELKYNEGMGDANNLPPTKVYWIRENVLKPIFIELYKKDTNIKGYDGYVLSYFNFNEFKKLLKKYGKTNIEIANEVDKFCEILIYDTKGRDIIDRINPEFYGYYSDYDWVVFCWLFGKMLDLPKGFPYYCKDLKQILDEKINDINNNRGDSSCPLVTAKSMKENHPNYPKQENEHNALDDAKWNLKLFDFLKKI